MKSYYITLFGILAFTQFSAQTMDTIKISREEAETVFIAKNLDLIAQKIEISQAEAQVVQAKLWPNPTLSISEVNLWKNSSAEEMPPLFRNWGQTSQIAAQIDQVIQTAGKRRKNIELQKIEVDAKKYELQESLRELKKELRNDLTELLFQQELKKMYQQQIISIQKLTKAFKNQYQQSNISKAEYMRLKAQEVDFTKKIVDVDQDIEDLQENLKAFLMIPSSEFLVISDPLTRPEKDLLEQDLPIWMNKAQQNRPDILLSRNAESSAKKNLELQNAMKTPDLAFSMNYDRGGNIMRDFIGVGVAFDLPIFDRNKGNIQDAKLEIEKKQIETKRNLLKSENEIVTAYKNYKHSQKMYQNLDTDFESSLDGLLVNYEKNFRERNLNMLEYLDFVDAYINNKINFLETKKELNQYLENLQYAIGEDL
ncbi:TolC family protein [Chryseobacterium sp. T1]